MASAPSLVSLTDLSEEHRAVGRLELCDVTVAAAATTTENPGRGDSGPGLFRTRLARVTPERHRFLTAMAAAGDGPVERAAIAAELGVPTTAVSRPRQQLIDRGFIESAGHGKLCFTLPGFAVYIRENV